MPSLSVYKSSLDYSYAPGFLPAMECLQHAPQRVRRVLIHTEAVHTPAGEKLTALAEEKGKRVEIADRVLQKVSGKENCYAAAVFTKEEMPLRPDRPHIVLHHPSDSGNVGTILRAGAGFEYEDMAVIRPCVDVFDPKTVRASMGSLFQMRVRLFESMEDYQAAYPEHTLYLFMLRGARPLQEVLAGTVAEPYALVFGNEGSGLPDSFAERGYPVRIESSDRIDSLNLSVASAIGCYAFRFRK